MMHSFHHSHKALSFGVKHFRIELKAINVLDMLNDISPLMVSPIAECIRPLISLEVAVASCFIVTAGRPRADDQGDPRAHGAS